MKDVKKLMQAIDSLLEKERGIKPEKMDSIVCFGADTDGSACIIHGNPGMLQAAIINEMTKDEAVATIILQAATVFGTIKNQPKKKIVS
jgi:hypothetical protein